MPEDPRQRDPEPPAPGAPLAVRFAWSRLGHRAPARRLRDGCQLGGGAERVFCYYLDYFVNQTSQLETGTWESPEVSGVQPLPRTFHTSSAAVGDCLYVFGGGDKGAEPVKDQQLHVFDSGTSGRVKGPYAKLWNPAAVEAEVCIPDAEAWKRWAPALALSLNGWAGVPGTYLYVGAGNLAKTAV